MTKFCDTLLYPLLATYNNATVLAIYAEAFAVFHSFEATKKRFSEN
jgi:hypothetical protein